MRIRHEARGHKRLGRTPVKTRLLHLIGVRVGGGRACLAKVLLMGVRNFDLSQHSPVVTEFLGLEEGKDCYKDEHDGENDGERDAMVALALLTARYLVDFFADA